MAPFQACVRTPFATLGVSATDAHVTGIRYLSPDVPALAPKKNTIAFLACVQLQAYLDDPAFAHCIARLDRPELGVNLRSAVSKLSEERPLERRQRHPRRMSASVHRCHDPAGCIV